MRVTAALGGDTERMRVPIRLCLFPGGPPPGRAGRRSAPADRTAVGYGGIDARPAQEGQRGMIEIIVVELIDYGGGGACGEKRIDPTVFKEDRDAGGGLIAKILAHDPAARRRIVGRTDAAQQEKPGVRHRKGCQHHDVGRLFVFLAGIQVEVAHANGAFRTAVVVNVQYLGARADFETLAGLEHGIQETVRRAFRVRLANEALAMTAVLAAAEALAIRIQIIPGGIGGWAGEGLEPESLCCGLEDDSGLRDFERRLRLVSPASRLERIAPQLNCDRYIFGLTG